jgi:hypothetical protein
MTPLEIAGTLTELFGAEAVNAIAPGSWQIETPDFRLLILLSDDQSWLRALLPIVPAQQARPFLEQFLEANFDETLQVRYALHEGVIWGVFHHNCNSLAVEDLRDAIARLVSLHKAGLEDVFNRLVESRVRKIIQVAKLQGQSLEFTMQNLERFYAEGLMGDENLDPQARSETLAAWRYQLERLWPEVEP